MTSWVAEIRSGLHLLTFIGRSFSICWRVLLKIIFRLTEVLLALASLARKFVELQVSCFRRTLKKDLEETFRNGFTKEEKFGDRSLQKA